VSLDSQPGRSRPASRVDPALAFGISLFIALAVTWPALIGAMHGTVDIVQAGVHLLVAEAVAWAGCYAVGSLMYGYAHGAGAGTPAAQAPALTAGATPQLRATDAPAGIEVAPSALEPGPDATATFDAA